MAKFTGPPRIRYLSGLFPDAYFVDIVRDPRAVVASLLMVKFWKQKGGFEGPFWNEALNGEALDRWVRSDRSPVVLAALQWRSVYQATHEEKNSAQGRYLRCRYEDFMEDPLGMVSKVMAFCRLSPSHDIERYISSQNYRNMNYKYREKLSAEEISHITDINQDLMEGLGYVLD
jgi:hypothetical protein